MAPKNVWPATILTWNGSTKAEKGALDRFNFFILEKLCVVCINTVFNSCEYTFFFFLWKDEEKCRLKGIIVWP